MWGKRADMVVHEEEPYNAEAPLAGLARQMITPLDTFYVRNHGPVPELDTGRWRLVVDGIVGRRLELSLEDLRRGFTEHRRMTTLQCAGNRRQGLIEVRDIPGEDPWAGGATSTAWWTGVSLAEVLTAAEVDPEASHVAFEAPDVSELAEPTQAYGSSIPLAKAMSGEALLAWNMNDEPLTPVHGAPLRVVVPGYIGARSVKWLRRISVQDDPSSNFFQSTAYRVLPPEADPESAGPGDGISLGPVALNSEILSPTRGQLLGSGSFTVTGYAHAGETRYVARVDVTADDGATWVQAELGDQVDGAWRLWHADVELASGADTITARAWDSTGACQPESARHLWNPKGYINNSWPSVKVRRA